MKHLSLTALLLAGVSAYAQQDTLITLHGDTTMVKVISTDEHSVTFQETNALQVTFTKDLDRFERVGFANSSLEDYVAPRYYSKGSSFVLGTGIDILYNQEADELQALYNFELAAVEMISRNWAYQIHFRIGGLVPGSTDENDQTAPGYFEFGISANRYWKLPQSNWHFMISGGLLYRKFELLTTQGMLNSSALGVRFNPLVGYTFKNGIELGYGTPLYFMNDNSASFGLNAFIAYRW